MVALTNDFDHHNSWVHGDICRDASYGVKEECEEVERRTVEPLRGYTEARHDRTLGDSFCKMGKYLRLDRTQG